MADSTLPRLPKRRPESHKGDYGHALLIGGCRGMAGAIAMAGMAAVRSGAGLVRLAVPDCCLDTVAGYSPCSMLISLPADSQGKVLSRTDDLDEWLSRSDCVAIGPGLGRSESIDRFVVDLLQWMTKQFPEVPVVIDADALVALSHTKSLLFAKHAPWILTPHPGEWAQLSSVSACQAEQQAAAAIDLSRQTSSIIVLKGHQTLITDGRESFRNQTGTPAMATGGSGDVLTGVIVALVCQGLSPLGAARLAVHVHGRAGQIAAESLETHVVLPTELISFLPAAFREVIG